MSTDSLGKVTDVAAIAEYRTEYHAGIGDRRRTGRVRPHSIGGQPAGYVVAPPQLELDGARQRLLLIDLPLQDAAGEVLLKPDCDAMAPLLHRPNSTRLWSASTRLAEGLDRCPLPASLRCSKRHEGGHPTAPRRGGVVEPVERHAADGARLVESVGDPLFSAPMIPPREPRDRLVIAAAGLDPARSRQARLSWTWLAR